MEEYNSIISFKARVKYNIIMMQRVLYYYYSGKPLREKLSQN